MRIDIIVTGGTIGTIVKNNAATLDNSLIYEQLTNNSRGHTIRYHNPYNIHSENLMPEHWQILFEQIKKIQDSDGIIIMHGTDTLSFTAGFLSLAFGKNNIPIILVSSQLPINDPASNAKDNFEMAITSIENKVKGVFVSYRNYDSAKTLYLANKLMGFSPYNNKLISTKEPFATIIDNKFTLCGDDFFQDDLPEIKFPMNKVVFIPAIPFTDYSFYLNSSSSPDCYLVELYHSTTCCINQKENKYSFAFFAEKCNEKGIKIFVSPYESREYFYPSKMYFQKCFPLYGDTSIIAYIRLLFKNL